MKKIFISQTGILGYVLYKSNNMEKIEYLNEIASHLYTGNSELLKIAYDKCVDIYGMINDEQADYVFSKAKELKEQAYQDLLNSLQ